MDATCHAGDDQEKLWNEVGGPAWVEAQELLDGMFRPFEKLLVAAVSDACASRILDVGCGAGSTTLGVAKVLGAQGHCVGIDISEPMIAAARAHAEREGSPASFIRGNAQNHAFEPAGFDMVISRFGVMFFDDPIRAFANLRRAASDDATLRFIVWRRAEDNPFMTTAERAAAPLLPNIPIRQRGGPGQFAFADQRRVRSILEESGWDDIDIQPIDVRCTLPEKDLAGYLARLGPLGRVLHDADEQTRTQVIEAVRPAFDRYVQGTDVHFTAACWTVGARATAVRRST
jgi:SAM-dependent methyltransferase